MKYFTGLMLLFTQITAASDTGDATPELKSLHLQINKLKQDLTELQKEVDELKSVKVTCICEISDGGSSRAGGYITGKGVTVFQAEKNAAESCKSRERGGLTASVFNCLDQKLDNVRGFFFPDWSHDLPRGIRRGPSG